MEIVQNTYHMEIYGGINFNAILSITSVTACLSLNFIKLKMSSKDKSLITVIIYW